jgi:alpha-L-fucosidase
MTINDSWGYQGRDRNFKSARQIIRIFAECIGMGGNLLLDVGPMADGTIPGEQVERLEALGSWIGRHAEAIYGTVAGLPAGHIYGASTLAAGKRILYVFLFDRPYDEIAIKGIRNGVSRVSVLGTGTALAHRVLGGAPWAHVPGVLWIAVPEKELDPQATVLKIELDGPLELYRGAGQTLESN